MYDRVHKGSYICDVQRKGWGSGEGGGGLEICHVFENSVVFKQCICFSFLQMRVRIGHVL